MSARTDTFDVAIIGSGLGGSCLAAILARHGHRTLLLEAQTHPRFAVGESVIPEFGARSKLLSLVYDVPELGYMSSFQRLRHRVSANSGVKRSFSFLYHHPGREHASKETAQFETMTYPIGPDSHVYRADLDTWLTNVAIEYGAVYHDRSPVDDVDLRDDGVTVSCNGTRYEARFVVDGSGFRSILSRKLGLAAEVDLATDSRCLFTHMVGVGSIDDARPRDDPLRVPSPPDQGTLHHIFEGGWLWVIPFDNHSLAVNPACSVGLTLDRRIHSDSDLAPEEEFRAFLERFPTVARQFESARAIRSWVKTGRLQHCSSRLAGDRWCLLPHAANFVDALFSGGMPLTLLGVHEVAKVLLRSLEDDVFDAARFAAMEEDTHANVRVQDTLVHGAFMAFRSYELFNAWYRIWAAGNYHSSLGLFRVWFDYLSSRDRSALDAVSSPLHRRVMGMGLPRLRALLDDGYRVLCRMQAGESTEEEAVDALFDLLGQADWVPPQLHLTDRERPYLESFTIVPLLRMILWGKRHAPDDMRETYYGIGPVYFRELVKSFGAEGTRSFSSFWRVFKDAHYARGRA